LHFLSADPEAGGYQGVEHEPGVDCSIYACQRLRGTGGGRQIEAEAGDTNVVLVTVVAVVASCSWVGVGGTGGRVCGAIGNSK